MPEPSQYDLFVCYADYADDDRAWVEGYLFDALEKAGVRYLSEAAFHLGVPRLLEFERAIRQSQRTLLVCSPALLVDNFNRFIDLLAEHYGLETGRWLVIPLILHPVELPPRLAVLILLNATDRADWPSVIERLCAELGPHPPLPPSPPPPPLSAFALTPAWPPSTRPTATASSGGTGRWRSCCIACGCTGSWP